MSTTFDKEKFDKTPRLQYSKLTDTVYIVLHGYRYNVTDTFDVIEHWRKE